MSTSLAYMLLFAKYHFTLDDTTPFYLVTNILGILWLLRIFRRKPEKTTSLTTRFGNGYLLINVFMLLLSAMGITVSGIALDTPVNYLMAIFMTISHILVFLFPLFSQNLVKKRESRKKSSTTIPHANKELVDLWIFLERLRFIS